MSRLRTGLTALRLARRLGPWADEAAAPEVPRREVRVPGRRPMRAWIYATPRARGTVLVVPGLHYQGPADPRLDRFCRVLAAAGLWVYAPFLPDFLDLRLDPQVIDDAGRAFDACVAHPTRPPGRPGVLSISFGSLPALRLAAARGDALAGLLCFGGYADWRAVLQFCLAGGRGAAAHDPLNRPVVFLALLQHLPGAPADPAPLAAAWRAFIEATWGRPELKAVAAFSPVAERIGAGLPPDQRRLFLQGCGVVPGGRALAESALARAPARPWLDPRPHLRGITCPVSLVHGVDDDVIPHTELDALTQAYPAARAWRTGLYGHTGRARGAGALAEARAMVGILGALARLPD